VPYSLAQQMRITSIAFSKGVDEPREAGIALTASERVAVPRIKDAPVSMECTFMQEVVLSNFSLVLGRILLVHISEDAVIDADGQHIDANKLDLIGRMEGGWYTTERFEMPNIPL
jgi:flavin reductase (DIM6/NTAB) family NADH-FMN oxidoreductase RutF